MLGLFGCTKQTRLFRRRSVSIRFVEIDVFGIYVAPISVVLLVGWIITSGMRRVAAGFSLLRHAWHAAPFVFADYVIVRSCMVLIVAH